MATEASREQSPAVRYTRDGVREGVSDGVAIGISYIPWGIAYGIAAQAILTVTQGLTLSAYAYSGTAQFVALGMWKHPIAIGSLLFAVFAINARYLLMGMTIAPWLRPISLWQRWGTLYFLTDAAWAASLRRFENGHRDVGYMLGVSVPGYLIWFLSTWAGFLLPLERVDPRAWGLDFAISAALVALAGARWSGRTSLMPWLVAALSAFLAQKLLGGNWYMIIGGVVGALAGAYRDSRS